MYEPKEPSGKTSWTKICVQGTKVIDVIDIVAAEIPVSSFKLTFALWKKLNLQSMANILNCSDC